MPNFKEYGRFVLSGTIGTAIFYVMYELVYRLLEGVIPFAVPVSWTSTYVVSILFQHCLHARIAFQNWHSVSATRAIYLKSLMAVYVAYALSLVVSPILSAAFDFVHIDHRLSFWLCIALTGALNYLTVSNLNEKVVRKDE
jgi:putative flippase GtrA